MDDDSDFSASDFDTAASAIASPDDAAETASAVDELPDLDAAGAPETPETPIAEVPVVVPEKPKGPIPFEVHSKALDNARSKAKEEALTQWRQQYGWAEQIPQEAVQRWGQTADRLLSDPVQYAADLLAELDDHPQYRQQAAALRQRLAATHQQQAQAARPPEPDVQIVDAHGQVVGMTYSDRQIEAQFARIKAEATAEALAQVQERMSPLEKLRAEVAEEHRMRAITTSVDQQLAEAAHWPHFTEHQRAIGIEVQKGADLKSAYHTVFFRDVYPQTTAQARAVVLGQQQKRAQAGTASPSGGGAMSVPIADSAKSFEQLFAEKAAQFGVG